MRQSKVQTYCESVIEAGWLAAVIVTPLFFNSYSSRVFEPDKITLVRTLALVMLAAYLIKVIDGGRPWLPAAADGAPPAPPAPAASSWTLPNLWRTPLLLPAALLAAAHIISASLSVAPHISWLGSYHRLQGVYTLLCYAAIALLAACHLRQPAQLRRLQHAIVLTSLPIAVYAAVQHFGRDPLPWGEDVTVRTAANAGNAIFLAAYLGMAFFLTLERVLSSFAFLLESGRRSNGKESADAPSEPAAAQSMAAVMAGSCYLFVLIVQILAIIWTQSRGPWLGCATGLYVFGLLLISGLRPRSYRRWTTLWVALGVTGTVLLILLNTTRMGDPFRAMPALGRLTTVLDSSSGTGRVRVLIWEGAARLVAPHSPLQYPDASEDALNALRPIFGYGPEAMWLAFNRFYPPELAQWESRNASPDRSHNETWDSLVFTGFFGFLAGSFLHLSIFFWALRWLGLIRSRRDAFLSLALQIGGGLLFCLLFLAMGASAGFLGVNWSTGLILGLIIYVTIAVFLQPESSTTGAERRRRLLLIALLSAIIGHYVEIHFGIAIAATRLYFWIFGAVLLTLGMGWLVPEPFALGGEGSSSSPRRAWPGAPRRSRRVPGRAASGPRDLHPTQPGPGRRFLPATLPVNILILLTLAYLYTTNSRGATDPIVILFSSLVRGSTDRLAGSGPAILWLLLFTWLISTVVSAAVALLQRPFPAPNGNRGSSSGRRRGKEGKQELRPAGSLPGLAKSAGLSGLVTLCCWVIYSLIFAGRLVPGASGPDFTDRVAQVAGHFTQYVGITVLWCLSAGALLSWDLLRRSPQAWMGRAAATACSTVLLTAVTYIVVTNANLAQVRADVYFKQGQFSEERNDWASSAELYRRALVERPKEGFYMLYLGRSLLTMASAAPGEGPGMLPAEPSMQDVLDLSAAQMSRMGGEDLMRAAETVLVQAQAVNPLNTDHAANLARLYANQAASSDDLQDRERKLNASIFHYESALRLSPNAVRLWNEKGGVLAAVGSYDEAEAAYLHSLALDDRFENTYGELAELYARTDELAKLSALLERGLAIRPNSILLLSHKGVAQSRSGDLEGALATHLLIAENDPDNFHTIRNLLILLLDLERPEEAELWANRATELLEIGGEAHGDGSLYSLIADTYYENGKLPETARALHSLYELAPQDFRAPVQLAQIYLEMDNVAYARMYGEQAFALAPEDEKPGIRSFIDGLD